MFFQKKKNQKGFTLIELLVTISIFVILTGVVIFNESKFNSTVLLTNLAYDTALTIRQAQTYGINVKEFGDSDFIPYGVHFERNAKSFILFADTTYDKNYPLLSPNPFLGATTTCITLEGCVNRYTIQRGNYISDLKVGNGTSVDTLDIVFKRPNPDALIYSGNTSYNNAQIYLKSADGTGSTTISVWSNGLIQIN
jgi:prepilin-type N-terminal cleavage/methylation domain-containing protein